MKGAGRWWWSGGGGGGILWDIAAAAAAAVLDWEGGLATGVSKFHSCRIIFKH